MMFLFSLINGDILGNREAIDKALNGDILGNREAIDKVSPFIPKAHYLINRALSLIIGDDHRDAGEIIGKTTDSARELEGGAQRVGAAIAP
jgi:hypothetical protein